MPYYYVSVLFYTGRQSWLCIPLPKHYVWMPLFVHVKYFFCELLYKKDRQLYLKVKLTWIFFFSDIFSDLCTAILSDSDENEASTWGDVSQDSWWTWLTILDYNIFCWITNMVFQPQFPSFLLVVIHDGLQICPAILFSTVFMSDTLKLLCEASGKSWNLNMPECHSGRVECYICKTFNSKNYKLSSVEIENLNRCSYWILLD